MVEAGKFTTRRHSASEMLKRFTEKLPTMDRETLAFVTLWFRLLSDAELEEAMLRVEGHVFGRSAAMSAAPLSPIYHSVAGLIRSAANLSGDELDKVLRDMWEK